MFSLFALGSGNGCDYQVKNDWSAERLLGRQSDLPAMSVAKGRSGLQPVYQPTTLPPDTRGRSYALPPTNPTGQTDTPRVLLICNARQRDSIHQIHVNTHRCKQKGSWWTCWACGPFGGSTATNSSITQQAYKL